MCLIVVAAGIAPHYPLIVAANRDEQHARPAARAAWWADVPGVLGGRDLKAGGTWLALGRNGRFAAVTNVRETPRPLGLRSRGALVPRFVVGRESAAEFAGRAAREGAEFGPFNLLLFDGRELHYSSNRADAAALGAGLHAFSNAPAGAEWPKTATARAGLARLLAEDALVEPLFALLAARDDSELPEQRYLRSHFVVGPIYGTRSSTVVLVDAGGRATFAERNFDEAGRLAGEAEVSFELQREA
jgi:uncharacterized protein with NRDE domain